MLASSKLKSPVRFLLVSATSLLTGIGMVAYSPGSSSAGASLRVANGLIAFTRQRPSGADQIVVMRSDGKGQRTLSTAAADDLDPAWSPNGRKIAFTNGNSDLVVMNADELASSNPALTITPGGLGAREANFATIEAVLRSEAEDPAHSKV